MFWMGSLKGKCYCTEIIRYYKKCNKNYPIGMFGKKDYIADTNYWLYYKIPKEDKIGFEVLRLNKE